ncbi:hypothetical protein BD410DRAFT_737383 [Rickenella mellea]|uniref:Phosphatidylglycerol/phosphatidylinositol transfer protein n=1 Tax=Rickenella mellea TaxID=50990 RepID=A0A4R5XG10_9AGAM|nr:hypothetical protein BD410DRAFT_737383 [Rickenella mellea]
MYRFSKLVLLVFAFATCLLTAMGAATQSQLPLTGPIRTTDSFKWEDCGLPTDPVELRSIEVLPDPPQPGKNLTVTVTAFVKEVIEDGAYADVTVKVGRVKILHKLFDVCEEARNANASVTCPVEPGEYQVDHTVELPKEVPKAKFTVAALGFTDDDDPMFCIDITVDFMKRPFPKYW